MSAAGRGVRSFHWLTVFDMSSSATPVNGRWIWSTLRIPVPSTVPGRLTTIDAARGAAMLFVFLAHFADIVVVSPTTRFYREQLEHIGMIASPMFLIVSGVVLGFLAVSRRADYRAVRYRMIDRSLLLLTIAHVLIAVANMPRLRHPSDAWRMVFITDTIAMCALLGCALIRVVPSRYRVWWSAVSYVLTWAVIICWQPLDLQTRFLKDLVFGPFSQESWAYVVPLLPWFSVYFAASTIGEKLARSSREHSTRDLSTRLIRLGVWAIFAGLAMKCCYLALLRLHMLGTGAAIEVFHLLTGPFAKIPPSPDYLAIYGGAGLALLGLLIGHAEKGQFAPLMSWLALIGRNSLLVFIVQYYVYFVLLHAIPRPPVISWPILFAASVAGIVATAWWWDARDGNRYLTIGLAWIVRHRDAPSGSLSVS